MAGSAYCATHTAEVEAERRARQPWRQGYKDAEYQKNRKRRYVMADGRCEDCGIAVDDGEWECDHDVALSDGGTNAVGNLRIRCIIERPGAKRGCHGLKTAKSRRSRRSGK